MKGGVFMDRKKVTVQIMLGGKSSRMGTDKAFVKLGGKTLLERAVEKWKDYGSALQLSVGPAERVALAPEGIPAVVDVYTGCGPIGGLHAGLKACETEYLLLVAVDTPFLTHELADKLVEVAEEYGCDACTYVLDGGMPQPLFSLYRVSCLPAAEDAIHSGVFNMSLLLARVHTEQMCPPDRDAFCNLNTPEDVAAAKEYLTLKFV